MNSYTVLNKQKFSLGKYSLVPIRNEDKFSIMKWRNDQIYHLRQAKPLTVDDQETYFNEVVARLFKQQNPDQILFSFLEEEKCIGYGGLVHINWTDKNAEISFVMDTALEDHFFKKFWQIYLRLIEQIAFTNLCLHKIFTFAFDLRPYLYEVIEEVGYRKEARLKEHCVFHGKFIDVIIHSKLSVDNFFLSVATERDAKLLFQWANDHAVRQSALNNDPIEWESHLKWLKSKLNSPFTRIFILYQGKLPLGQIRFDYNIDTWEIDYSVDQQFRGKGLGKKMVELAISEFESPCLVKAKVKKQNVASLKVFQKLGFEQIHVDSPFVTFQKNIL
ncbi:GNAT family N-acetyltransferase [Algoriphagus sp. Y33]|uniref:GNAT family N-acetyltransferase n=1 Tax=Algoriphagus sp. Y33 TaxID=2772483 RepID=UPI0017818CEC|nr:GNAT family N-acetyltransferase [Algoriphagus sp. Y33]